MECPATAQDVQSRFPRALTAAEEIVAETLLDDAWTDLQDTIEDLVERLEGNDDQAVVDKLLTRTVRVLAQSVKRVLLNPFGRKQESRGIDDAQRSWTLDDALQSGALYFTDAEIDSLTSADDDSARGKAFSVIPA